MGRRLRSLGREPEKAVKRKRELDSEPQRPLRRTLRRAKTICSCSSPSPSSTFLNAHSTLSWFEKDLWTEIAKFLDGRSLVMLAATSQWFHRVIMEDSIWKYVCLRDLQVAATCHSSFKWIDLYASAFGMDQTLSVYLLLVSSDGTEIKLV
ncbi:F-box domain containing protein [Parasponia andersonii]|uniref:F-box domain containing protein n=1 Tax=Parasponia andersonii TaxID=3476 RepID=A0A2P5BRA5_PARAD|nr:F-box domain containing protein [Parasponia andersonii]